MEGCFPCRPCTGVRTVRWSATCEWISASEGCPWPRSSGGSSAPDHAPPCFGFQSSNGPPCTSAYSLTCCLPSRQTCTCGGGKSHHSAFHPCFHTIRFIIRIYRHFSSSRASICLCYRFYISIYTIYQISKTHILGKRLSVCLGRLVFWNWWVNALKSNQKICSTTWNLLGPAVRGGVEYLPIKQFQF